MLNIINLGKPSGGPEETVLARWNATEVYRRIHGTWQMIHTHWCLRSRNSPSHQPFEFFNRMRERIRKARMSNRKESFMLG